MAIVVDTIYTAVRRYIGDNATSPRYSDANLAEMAVAELSEVQTLIESYDPNAFLDVSSVNQSANDASIALPTSTRNIRFVRRTDNSRDIPFRIIPKPIDLARDNAITGSPYTGGREYYLYLQNDTLKYVKPIAEAHTVELNVTLEEALPVAAASFSENIWDCDSNVLIFLVANGILAAEQNSSSYLQSRLGMALETQRKRRENRDTSTPRSVNYIAT